MITLVAVSASPSPTTFPAAVTPFVLPVVSTVAGLVGVTGSANGLGTDVRFYSPSGVAVDASGTIALVADGGNNQIRRLDIPAGIVSPLAGSGSQGYADGIKAAASFSFPRGIAVDAAGVFAFVVSVVFANFPRFSTALSTRLTYT